MGAEDRVERHVPFVGREAELSALQTIVLEDGIASSPVVVVYGDAGIGKTALIREFARRASARGIDALRGSCGQKGALGPFRARAEALREQILGVSTDQLEAVAEGNAVALSRLVPEIARAHPDSPAVGALDPVDARLRLFDAVTEVLSALGERCLVVLDDLQWADPETLDMLVHVARVADRAALIVLFRGSERNLAGGLAAPLAELHRARGCEYLRLEPLPRAAAGELVQTIAGTSVDGPLLDLLYRRSDGNPFFLTELARHLRSRGKESVDELPETIRTAVALQLSSVSVEARRILEAACALTQCLTFADLQLVADLDESRLLDCVDQAESAGLLRVVGGDCYEFAHTLVRRVIYESLGPGRRARLHRHIAHALENLPEAERVSHAHELARQYHALATLPGAERGVAHALLAAEQAVAAAAPALAVELLLMALDMVPACDIRGRGEVTGHLAVAQARAMMHTEAARTAERAVDLLLQSHAEPATIADLLYWVGYAFQLTLALPGAQFAERALSSLTGLDSVHSARLKVLDLPRSWDSAGAVRIARYPPPDRQALSLIRAEGTEMDYARSLWNYDPWTAEELREQLEKVQRLNDPTARLHGLIGLGGHSFTMLPDPALVERVADEIEVLGRELGAEPAITNALLFRSAATGRAGRLEEAVVLATQALSVVERWPVTAFTPSVPVLFVMLAEQHLKPEWEWTASEAWRIATSEPTPYFALSLMALAALANIRAGHEARARSRLADVLPALARSQPYEAFANLGLGLAAEAIAVLGDQMLAIELMPTASRLIAAGAGDSYMTQHDLTTARLEVLLGHTDAATAAFERARTALEARGERPLRAIVDYEDAALRRAVAGSGSEELLAAARAQFEKLGMIEWSARLARVGANRNRPPNGLTVRELEVLRLLASGMTNREIAEVLVLSVHTVERHVQNVYGKIGARNRADATAHALGRGIAQAARANTEHAHDARLQTNTDQVR